MKFYCFSCQHVTRYQKNILEDNKTLQRESTKIYVLNNSPNLYKYRFQTPKIKWTRQNFELKHIKFLSWIRLLLENTNTMVGTMKRIHDEKEYVISTSCNTGCKKIHITTKNTTWREAVIPSNQLQHKTLWEPNCRSSKHLLNVHYSRLQTLAVILLTYPSLLHFSLRAYPI